MAIFIGPPGQLVRLRVPIGRIRQIRFDSNGNFETDNIRLIGKLSSRYTTGDADQEVIADKIHSCKKCDFTADNNGKLMAHYKSEHKKEAASK